MEKKKKVAIQATPDNSNLLGRSKEVRVSGSSRNRELTEQTTEKYENGWGMNEKCTLQSLINTQCRTLYLNWTEKKKKD